MIKVLINGTPIYKLCFSRKEYSRLKNGQPLYETSAIIYLADAKQGEPAIAKASARQWHKDPYKPEAARRAALKALLRTAEEGRGAIGVPFARAERTAIWTAYLNRPRIISTPPKGQPPAAASGSAPAAQQAVVVPPVPKDAGRPGVKAKPSTPNTHPVVSKVVPIARPWFAPPSTVVH
jgi:hypothetical protein